MNHMNDGMSVKKTREELEYAQKKFITGVYTWMTLALFITGIIAAMVVTNPNLAQWLVLNRSAMLIFIVSEFLLVLFLSANLHKMSATTAMTMFVIYAVLNGLTLSTIFFVYTASSIAGTFFITAGTFAAMSLYGYTTKKDLTSIGNIGLMALVGIIIASIVNMFLKSPILYWAVTYIGVIVFVGLTAYDTQKIKNIGLTAADGSEGYMKLSIIGALELYLDFINLFLYLLRIFGKRN